MAEALTLVLHRPLPRAVTVFRRCPMRPRDAPDQKNGGLAACRVTAGKRRANTNPRPYFSPSDTLRDGFLAARGVLSRWYSSLPVRDSASCAASRVFLAAISASMPASVARSWSRYDLSATISCTSDSRRCALKALTVFCLRGPRVARRRDLLTPSVQALDRVLLLREVAARPCHDLLRVLDGLDGVVSAAAEPPHTAGATCRRRGSFVNCEGQIKIDQQTPHDASC